MNCANLKYALTVKTGGNLMVSGLNFDVGTQQ